MAGASRWLWPAATGIAGLAAGLLLGRSPASSPADGLPPAPARAIGAALAAEDVRRVVREELAVRGTVVLRHSEKSDSTVQGRGVPNYLGAALIAPDGLSAWVPSKQDNIKRGSRRDGLPLDFQNTVRAVSSRIDLRSLADAGHSPAAPVAGGRPGARRAQSGRHGGRAGLGRPRGTSLRRP